MKIVHLMFYEDEIHELKKTNKLGNGDGPIATMVDDILQDSLSIKRQAFHSGSFVGNHCHKLLKVLLFSLLFPTDPAGKV